MDKEELGKLEDLKTYSESTGGKYLIDSSKQTCMNLITNISNSYLTLDEIALKGLCAKLAVNLDMYQLLTGLPNQIESIKKLFESTE